MAEDELTTTLSSQHSLNVLAIVHVTSKFQKSNAGAECWKFCTFMIQLIYIEKIKNFQHFCFFIRLISERAKERNAKDDRGTV